MSRWVLLEPEDVLLFRDARPFTAGADFRAEGIFPPQPGTVAGAIRAALLSPWLRRQGKTFADLPGLTGSSLGGPNSMGDLRLVGPLVCLFSPAEETASLLFPAPADLIGDRVPRLRRLPALPSGSAMDRKLVPGLPDGRMPMAVATGDSESTDAETGRDWLRECALIDYLTGSESVKRVALRPSLPENRIGIEIGARRTVNAGKFYNVLTQRPAWDPITATGLLVRVELPDGIRLPPGYVTVGGESRSMYLREGFLPQAASAETRARLADAVRANGGRFKLLLATPGIFAAGLMPRALLGGNLAGVDVECIAVASGKPIAVSGWSLRGGKPGEGGGPRVLRRAVPAGSVYYGRLRDPNRAGALVDALHFTAALQEAESDLPESEFRSRQGFGGTLVGTWTEEEA